MKKTLLLLLFMAAVALSAVAQKPLSTLVPKPVEQKFRDGEAFLFDVGPILKFADNCPEGLRSYARRRLSTATMESTDKASRLIVLSLSDDGKLPAEGYKIDVVSTEISVAGKDYAGIVHGIETLAQLLSDGPQVPAQTITDYPRYPYRAMHLDVSRTFTGKKGVLRYIDQMARLKINHLHWHLTDDEGWRVEIKSYPRLTSVGAWRGFDLPVKPSYGAWDEERYGGYFTQDDIREIVAYAAERAIEIIPEVDLPGHSRAAARAYPEILCPYQPDTTAAGFDMRNVWCATSEANFEMLDRILGEIAELFPSEYIHVGGDEVEHEQWESCPTCGPVMRRHGENYLNGQFLSRLGVILAGHGKKQAVWNEAMNGGNLPQDALISGWEDVSAVRRALNAGYPVVVMPGAYCYFDMRQADGEVGALWAGIVELKKAYSLEPDTFAENDAQRALIRGVEGTLWAERLLEYGPWFLEYQTSPRMCALAEVGWSRKEHRDWGDFERRMNDHHFARLAAAGVGFRIEPPVIGVANGRITAKHTLAGVVIRYTADGSEPSSDSPQYTEPLVRREGDVYKFTAWLGSGFSRAVGVPGDEDRMLTPAVTLTSSIPDQLEYPFANGVDYKDQTYVRTTRAPRAGDWFLWTFATPVKCSRIEILTGVRPLRRFVVPFGVLEVSYDGVNFEMADAKFSVVGTVKPAALVKTVRLTATRDYNGEDFTAVRDLRVVE